MLRRYYSAESAGLPKSDGHYGLTPESAMFLHRRSASLFPGFRFRGAFAVAEGEGK
jgi:hypothetical protein